MDITTLHEAIEEAERFLARARTLKGLLDECDPKKFYSCWPGVESGAVKRSSMDLTRALARLRKPAR